MLELCPGCAELVSMLQEGTSHVVPQLSDRPCSRQQHPPSGSAG